MSRFISISLILGSLALSGSAFAHGAVAQTLGQTNGPPTGAVLTRSSEPTNQIVPVDPAKVLSQARESVAHVPSLFLSDQQKLQVVETLVKIVRIYSPSKGEAGVADVLRQILAPMGAEELKCGHTGTNLFSNLVMVLPATTEFKDRPAMILNAHMDTIRRTRGCTQEEMDFNAETREFFHKREGSFGADDKAGVAVILGAVKAAMAAYWDKGVGHRRVILIFTAQEEIGAFGAIHLAEQHPDIFKNVEISITNDGPLDYDRPAFYPKDSFIVVADEKMRNVLPYRKMIEYVQEVCALKHDSFSITTTGLGQGDFAFFRPQAHSEHLHIRSPYQGDHAHERVKLDDLFNHIDLFTYIVLRLDGPSVRLHGN